MKAKPIIWLMIMFISLNVSGKYHRITVDALSPNEAVMEHYKEVDILQNIQIKHRYGIVALKRLMIGRHKDGSVWEYRYTQTRRGTNGDPTWWHRIERRMLFSPTISDKTN